MHAIGIGKSKFQMVRYFIPVVCAVVNRMLMSNSFTI